MVWFEGYQPEHDEGDDEWVWESAAKFAELA
jgi:hypothetical protein